MACGVNLPSAFWCGYLGLPLAGIYIYNHNVLGEWLGKAIAPGMAGEVQQPAELKRESSSGLVETRNWFGSKLDLKKNFLLRDHHEFPSKGPSVSVLKWQEDFLITDIFV